MSSWERFVTRGSGGLCPTYADVDSLEDMASRVRRKERRTLVD